MTKNLRSLSTAETLNWLRGQEFLPLKDQDVLKHLSFLYLIWTSGEKSIRYRFKLFCYLKK